MTPNIFAIGGGNLQKQETRFIDEAAIACTNKEHPRVLFFPSASHDDQGYAKRFKQYYRSLGCDVDAIRLFHTKKTKVQLHQEILGYDMVYIGGGDTTLLLQVMQEWELKDIFQQAWHQGIVLVGYSAGANILFTYGYSECQEGYSFVKGFDFIHGVYSPHYQKRPQFTTLAEAYRLPVYGCEDGTALWVSEDVCRKLTLEK